ncbi:hypothetical protein BDV97DRAFT_98326 [Delphinella strobiligena]|nr:hypothetical protein BDV97DRAFT_98326 [Delphinella strobiligena]
MLSAFLALVLVMCGHQSECWYRLPTSLRVKANPTSYIDLGALTCWKSVVLIAPVYLVWSMPIRACLSIYVTMCPGNLIPTLSPRFSLQVTPHPITPSRCAESIEATSHIPA